jgi:hypothetical protein
MNMSEKLPVCENGGFVESNGNPPKADKSKASLFLLEKLAANSETVVNVIASKAGECLKMDKSKALRLLLDKIAAHQREIVNSISRRADAWGKGNKIKMVPLLFLSVCLISHSQGFCAEASQTSGLDSVTKNVMDVVFSSGIKKSILVLAAAWGLFQSVSSGSFKPLLLWGGIGLAIAYVPKLIDIIANVG